MVQRCLLQFGTAVLLFGFGYSLASAAEARMSYASLSGGVGELQTPDKNLFNPSPSSSNKHEMGGAGGRVLWGYNLNEIFGVEIGYTQFEQSKYEATQNSSSASLKFRDKVFDLSGRVSFDAPQGFGVFATAGIAYVEQDSIYSNPDDIAHLLSYAPRDKKEKAVRPIGGLGVNYKVNNNISVFANVTYLFGRDSVDKSSSAIADGNLYAAGIMWTFY